MPETKKMYLLITYPSLIPFIRAAIRVFELVHRTRFLDQQQADLENNEGKYYFLNLRHKLTYIVQ